MAETAFTRAKAAIRDKLPGAAGGLATQSVGDKSPKGSVDAGVLELVREINLLPDFVTTSSCSGRVSLFQGDAAEAPVEDAEARAVVPSKGGGRWLAVNHDAAWTAEELSGFLAQRSAGTVVFKMEPVVLHVLCSGPEAAQRLLRVAVEAGCRESGLSIGARKVMVGIRTISNTLEVPLVHADRQLVPTESLAALCEVAAAKFAANVKLRDRLLEGVRAMSKSSGEAIASAPAAKDGIAWTPFRPTQGAELLERWGHAAVQLASDSSVLVFGGYGTSGNKRACHQRLNDLVRVERFGATEWSARAVTADESRQAAPCPRVRHACALLAEDLLLITGGREGPARPLGDVHALDARSAAFLSVTMSGASLAPRWGHTATRVNANTVLIFGGREADALFGDLVQLAVTRAESGAVQVQVQEVATSGPRPSPRYSHSATMLGDHAMAIFGGYGGLLVGDEQLALGDLHVLDTGSRSWSRVQLDGPRFGRFSHQALHLGEQRLLVAGGMSNPYADSGTMVIDVASGRCFRVEQPDGPLAQSGMLHKSALVHLQREGQALALGGGSLCFSFGFCFSPSFVADLASMGAEAFALNAVSVPVKRAKEAKLVLEAAGLYDKSRRIAPLDEPGAPRSMAVPIAAGQGEKSLTLLHAAVPEARLVWAPLPRGKHTQDQKGLRKAAPLSPPPATAAAATAGPTPVQPSSTPAKVERVIEGPVVWVGAKACKQLKSALEEVGLFDKSRSIAKTAPDAAVLAVPVLALDQVQQVATTLGLGALETGTASLPRSKVGREQNNQQQQAGRRRKGDVNAQASGGGKPGSGIRSHVMNWLRRSFPEECAAAGESKLKSQVPNKIELLGDVAIIPRESFRSEALWTGIMEAGERDASKCLWAMLARLVGAKRVLLQQRIDPGVKRQSRARLAYPRERVAGDAVVTVRQNGITYSFDLEKCMFSSGNISEKLRVASFPCEGEVVVDLFAGIGYFTLPYLVKARVAHLHACEWNADALEALRGNLAANKVEPERYTVHPGDNRITVETKLAGVADRVNLGLIPSSRPFWAAAARCLSARGGWLHIHENVARAEQQEWVGGMVDELTEYLTALHGPGWTVECAHLERVKSYSPRVDHVVADVRCLPPGAAASLASSHGAATETPGCGSNTRSRVAYPPRGAPEPVVVRTVPFPRSREEAVALFAAGEPLILSGAVPDASLAEWRVEALQARAAQDASLGDKAVSAHVAHEGSEGRISFVHKSFSFEVMALQALLERVSAGDGPACYLRAVGANPRKQRAHFWKDWPELAQLLPFPDALVDRAAYFSSVLRIASRGLQLWTHYDVMDNVLFQLAGRKRVVLFRPSDVGALDMRGSSSGVTDIDALDQLDPSCPFAQARRVAGEVELQPGQALFIPALWPHNARADEASVAVNVFWKTLSEVHYGAKDLYGNRDPLLAEQALALAARAKDLLCAAQDDGTTLPPTYQDFYARMAADALLR